MAEPADRYVPALGWHGLTSAYDALIGRFFPENAVKSRLLDLAGIAPGERALDLGCGTGTLLAMAEARGAAVTGIDADPRMLARARPKLRGAHLIQGLTHAAELPEDSFDLVISSLFFHHLRRAEKQETLSRARRWLKPGGRLVIADFCRPAGAVQRALFTTVRVLDGFGLTQDVLEDAVPRLIDEVGFQERGSAPPVSTLFGPIGFWTARAP